ncbi:MAG TPA: SCP2 sterol-binding domain-containing protein [Candidatus Limnocylindrales bacterium]|nr:SCP2 sterol-binding domain-containing protein [Candidatus Limnocylindrales bacterium]
MSTPNTAATQGTLSERLSQIFDAFVAYGPGAATTTTRYLFRLTGQAPGSYMLVVSPEGVSWEGGDAAPPDVTIRIDANDLVAIADGSLDGRLALASEKMELAGDLEAAARMVATICPAEAES